MNRCWEIGENYTVSRTDCNDNAAKSYSFVYKPTTFEQNLINYIIDLNQLSHLAL